MSVTPRTDAVVLTAWQIDDGVDGYRSPNTPLVHADFARELEIDLAVTTMHLEAACEAAGHPETSSEPLSSAIKRMVRELTSLSGHNDRLTNMAALVDQLEVYGQPDWPCGVSFAITGFAGRYESARAAIDAALLSDAAPQGAA